MTSLSLFADTTSEPVTMTSTEIVDFINAHRKQEAEASGAAFPSSGFPKLERKNFLAKVPEVLGAETSAKFSADLPDSYGRLQPGYRLPKREATLLAMSYSYTLQAAVYDHMTALENKLLQSGKPAPAIANTALTNDIAALDLLARVLNVAASGKLGMMRFAISHHAPHLLPALPGYAIDAPKQGATVAGSSEPTFSATHLLKEHGVKISAVGFNKLLRERGVLSHENRRASNGRLKAFWSVTDKGLPFGKNVVSDKNPRETQPHWYASKFAQLLAAAGAMQ